MRVRLAPVFARANRRHGSRVESKMKRFVSGAVALIAAGGVASAQAADIPYGSRAPYTVNQPLNLRMLTVSFRPMNEGSWG